MGNDGDNLDRDAPVTREEYEGLFKSIVRLTDRIEALEKAVTPLGFKPDAYRS